MPIKYRLAQMLAIILNTLSLWIAGAIRIVKQLTRRML